MSLILENEFLKLHMLHPVEDAERLGARYVHGGYVWQAETRGGEPLFAGPEFPRTDPTPFDGQGVPEVFRWYELLTKRRLNLHAGVGLCPGLGLIQDIGGYVPRLLQAAPWTVETGPSGCVMCSSAQHEQQGYALRREVALTDTGFLSRTHVRNTGAETMELHWFAHPFFPLTEEAEFSLAGFRLPENAKGYETLADGAVRVTHAREDLKGLFQMLQGGPSDHIDITLSHPVTGSVRFRAEMPCAYLPVWANAHTVSPEPHRVGFLEPGQEAEWHLEYLFPGL